MVYDLDRPDSALAWNDSNLPPPAWVAVNPENGHCHVSYGLIAPVARTEAALAAPLRLAAAIEAAYCAALDADRSYAGLITKNPLHPHWHTFSPATAANSGYYELLELAEYVTLLKKLPAKRSEIHGLGRNCALFDSLRQWAYSAVRDFWAPNGGKPFSDAVLERACTLNAFPEPLPIAEVAATAKSVADYTWKKFTPASFRAYVDATHTPEIQSARGKLGNAQSIIVRSANAAENAARARELSAQGYSSRQIAATCDVNQSTVVRWLKL